MFARAEQPAEPGVRTGLRRSLTSLPPKRKRPLVVVARGIAVPRRGVDLAEIGERIGEAVRGDRLDQMRRGERIQSGRRDPGTGTAEDREQLGAEIRPRNETQEAEGSAHPGASESKERSSTAMTARSSSPASVSAPSRLPPESSRAYSCRLSSGRSASFAAAMRRASGSPALKEESLKAYNGGSPSYLTQSTTAYDSYGRPVETTDVRGNKTTTAYAPATGGPLTGSTVTGPLGWQTFTTIEPAWGTTVYTKDPNGRVTETAYDPLGRLAKMWLPGRTSANQTANTVYEYLVRNNAPTVTTTKTLVANGSYKTGYAFQDGLLRERQTQAPDNALGPNAVVTKTFHDSAGRAYKKHLPYLASAAPIRAAVAGSMATICWAARSGRPIRTTGSTPLPTTILATLCPQRTAAE